MNTITETIPRLFPHHILPSYALDSPVGLQAAAQTAGSLLCFTHLELSTLATVGHTTEDTKADFESLYARHDEHAVQRYLEHGEQGDLSIDETFTIDYVKSLQRYVQFRTEYAPLIDEGVIILRNDIDSMERTLGSLQGESKIDVRLYATLLDPEVMRQATVPKELIPDLSSRNEEFGTLVTAYYQTKAWKKIIPKGMPIWEPGTKRRGMLMSGFAEFDLIAQCVLPAIRNDPVLFWTEDDCRNYMYYSAPWRKQESISLVRKRMLAQRLFGAVLLELPTVIPKSPEAILEVRLKLADELAAFRAAVSEQAMKLALQDNVSDEEIDSTVYSAFQKPVEDLKRKLSHPNRDLLSNLVPGFCAVLTYLGLRTLPGVTDVTQLLTGLGTAATLAQGLHQTRRQHKQLVDNAPNGVGFLFQAEANNV